jgi:hypothetical protein
MLRGIGDEQAAQMTWEHLEAIRERLDLRPGEHLQLRIGA